MADADAYQASITGIRLPHWAHDTGNVMLLVIWWRSKIKTYLLAASHPSTCLGEDTGQSPILVHLEPPTLSAEGAEGSIKYLDGHFRAWDLTTGQCIISLQTKIHSAPASDGPALSVSPDDHWIVSVRDRNVKIIALDTFSVTRELNFTGLVYDAAVSHDSQFLLVLFSKTSETESSAWGFASHEHQEFLLSKFSIDNGDKLASIRPPSNAQGILAVSSDARFVVIRTAEAIASSEEGACVILADTRESLYQFRLPSGTYRASLIQDNSILVLCDRTHKTFRDFTTGLLLRRLEVDIGFQGMQFDFDANTLEVHTNFGTLALHEAFNDETRKICLD
ncbi:hypothetical protein FMUND_5631 [Fusarium mundagurra]|uniref:Uncharacterized protein n=1 Tax=Fusarium mundagurra TaxID=1567541 RepID=A0A8H5YUU5_9HYPO|nr:hypothetical protein FMUND_5631 [Fusarium mundagurra]